MCVNMCVHMGLDMCVDMVLDGMKGLAVLSDLIKCYQISEWLPVTDFLKKVQTFFEFQYITIT